MLIYKRIGTAVGCFLPLAAGLFFLVIVIGGGIVAAKAGAAAGDAAAGAEAGRVAGEEFGKRYGGFALFGSTALAALVAFVLSFGGVFPWCRKPKLEAPAGRAEPPDLG